MLSELRIRDFAIIDDLSLRFDSGFVVFTGETGAGKSIIIDAVEMLLGGRADSSFVRTGADVAVIEGTFKLEGITRDEVARILEKESLLDDPNYLVLGREIRSEGRNVCRLNGRTVTLGLLRQVGEWLVDVHGQSEHLSLLRVREHIHLLDRYAHAEGLKGEYIQAYEQLRAVRQELNALREKERDAARRTDLLTYQLEEIEMAALQPGEDSELLEERNRLANSEELATLAEQVIVELDESPDMRPAATDLIGRAAHALRELAKLDDSMEPVSLEAQALVEQASELARTMRSYLESVEFNPKRLDEVEERLALISDLKRKYGDDIEAILAHAEQAASELEAITHAEERLQTLESGEDKWLHTLGDIAQQLSHHRRQAADELAAAIGVELEDLRMAGASFAVEMERSVDPQGVYVGDERLAFNADGLDDVEFLVETNLGEGLKPLVKIASGGETSRLMLALKSVLARADRTPTLIFDEIDQGIGGRVGAIVGQKMWGLSRNHQVVCITHLPQLAAYGDQHVKVEKRLEQARTVTEVRALGDSERIPELSFMFGGVTESNLESATDMLRQAMEDKAQITAN
ncbi:MAG: DNA repair protein RecN [Anaerolineales bacterium]|jgi:DNA repair protein RecN (Recombination protein N)